MSGNIVVVGAGSAGASACFAARKQNRSAQIVCINKDPYPTYSRCALPFVIGGEIPSFDTPTVFSFDFFRSQKIEIMPSTCVLSADTGAKVIKTSAGEVEYSSLVIATGGQARMVEMPGTGLDGVFVLRTRDDGAAILKQAQPGKKAVINGASFVALEIAEALKGRGLVVTCVIRSRALRSMIDQVFSRLVEEKLVENGIAVLKGSPVTAVLGKEHATGVVVGGEEIPADLVLMCTGTTPEVELARSMGVKLGTTGGIRIDNCMQTSAPDVYAAGDCVESECFVRKSPVLSGLGTIATRQGMAAGANAAGGNAQAPPVLGASVMKLFDIEIGAIGLTEDVCKDSGVEIVSITTRHPTLPHYYPGGTEARARLHARKSSGRVVGAQVVVGRGAAERVNMLSVAILKGISVAELHMADFCYSPPCADVWAAETIAAGGLARRLARNKK